MRLSQIEYQLAMIILLFSVEINSERAKKIRKGGENVQDKIAEDGKSLKKQPSVGVIPLNNESDDESKKTLAQQVLDGKYGLIQTELFSSPVKRPGIISYEINPEVPKDNINNLGGLKSEEIWLAENHLLVLKGGGFAEKGHDRKVTWPPIDSYVAPKRPVKIPRNPKIPPPFPIQLEENGPVRIIEDRNRTTGQQSYFGPPFLFNYPAGGPNRADGNETNQMQGNFTQGNEENPFPFLPPGIGLFPHAIPFLPSPENLTELDEDDPSLYYPPRYDFVYNPNYTSFVPPGPLVPGIILPPPPNFFAPLENKAPPPRQNTANKVPFSKKPNRNRIPVINKPSSAIKTRINGSKRKGPHSSEDRKVINPFQQVININQDKIILKNVYENVTKEEWIPIPAPRPYYITDINKIKKLNGDTYIDHSLTPEVPKNGWVYQQNTKQEIPIINEPPTYTTSVSAHRNIGYQTTGLTNQGFDLGDTQKKFPDSTRNYVFQSAVYDDQKKYLYISNNNEDLKVRAKNPIVKTYKPLSTCKDGTLLAPNIICEEDYRSTLVTTKKPLSVLDYNQENQYQDNEGYIYDIPGRGSPINSYETRPINLQPYPLNKKKVGQFTTTAKPPVYEYSFLAQGYQNIINQNNFETKSKPKLYEPTLQTVKQQPQYTYYNYKSVPKQVKYQGSPIDLVSPSVQPPHNGNYEYVNTPGYQTESPYTAYTTPNTALIDEHNGKYFSLFGQRVSPHSVDISNTFTTKNHNYYTKQFFGNYDSRDRYPVPVPNKDVRFPERYNIQSDNPCYDSGGYADPKYRDPLKRSKRNAAIDGCSYNYEASGGIGTDPYDQKQSYGDPNAQHPDGYSDVNYKTANSDTEQDKYYVDPVPIGQKENSYVSYRLPANSGHFFFLISQSTQNQNPVTNSRIRFPENGARDS